MKLKSKILLSILAASSAAFAQTAPAAPESTIAYNIGVVSEYRYRGLDQTKGLPAIQGGFDYSNANGAYLGLWASQVRWIKDASTSNTSVSGNSEVDIYGGYKFEKSGVTYDLGLLTYIYPGNTLKNIGNNSNDSDLLSANTTEVYGAASIGAFTLKYSNATTDLFGYKNSKGSTYIDLTANFDMGSGITLTPHIGRQAVKGTTSSYYPGGLSYSDYALTIAKDMGNGITATVSSISTNAKNNANFKSNQTLYNAAKETIVVGVKYTF